MKLVKIYNNLHEVVCGGLTVWFSYETPIAAFHADRGGLIISENIWSNTTGKHLNYIQPDKSARIPHEEFKEILKGWMP